MNTIDKGTVFVPLSGCLIYNNFDMYLSFDIIILYKCNIKTFLLLTYRLDRFTIIFKCLIHNDFVIYQ